MLTTDLVTDSDELADTPIMSVVHALMVQSETFRHRLRTRPTSRMTTRHLRYVSRPAVDGQQLPDTFFEKFRRAFVPVTPEPWFPRFLAHLDEYIAAHGDATVPLRYVCPDGYRLGMRVSGVVMRESKPAGRRRNGRSTVTSEMITELDARAFDWQVYQAFSGYLSYLDAYIAEYGNALVPAEYVCPDGYRLGPHTASMRSRVGWGD